VHKKQKGRPVLGTISVQLRMLIAADINQLRSKSQFTVCLLRRNDAWSICGMMQFVQPV